MVRHEGLSRPDHLRFLGITAKTRRSYEQAVQAFFVYLRALRGRLPKSMVELDEELSEYINHLYQEGDNVTQAGWTVSGLKRFLPRCKPHLQTAQLRCSGYFNSTSSARPRHRPSTAFGFLLAGGAARELTQSLGELAIGRVGAVLSSPELRAGERS